jgi:PAS domain S-box-containing protein
VENPDDKIDALVEGGTPSRRALRDRARAALEAGIDNLQVRSFDENTYSVNALVEDLRVYQAELEIQNEQLRDTQQAAQNAARRFAALFTGVPVAVLVIENFGLVSQCNPAALRLFGLEDRHLRHNFLLRLVERSDHERVAGALNRLFGGEDTQCTDLSFRGMGGKTFTGDLHLAYLEGLAPGARQYICAVVDQTAVAEKRRELQEHGERLQTSEQRLGAVIDAALHAIIVLDSRGRIVVFNPAAEKLFECASEMARNTTLAAFFPAADTLLQSAPGGRDAPPREWAARSLGGRELTVEVALVIDTGHGAPFATLFVRDVSALKAQEEERKQLELRMLESQKMEAVGILAGGIAHDFNNMLGAILGNVALARQDAADGSPVMESLLEIEKAGVRARELVRQILAFSRKESARRERLELRGIITETVGLVRTGLPPGVDFGVDIAPDLPPILGDPAQVQQAILNLCTNAIDAVRDGGRVAVEARAMVPEEAMCRTLGLVHGPHVSVQVSDNGCGMSAEVLQHAFEPFFTTKPVGQGTGLGLAVVHGAMRTHHGAVQVESRPGAGSVFTLYFPAAVTEIGALAAPPAKLPGASAGHGEHVMYVDDDEALVFLIERLLGRKGYRVSGFVDPGAALAFLKRDPEAVDLLITDYNMPGMSGFDVAREARAIRANLPMMLSSGYVTKEMEAAAAAAGIEAVLHKPNQVEQMCDMVQRAISQLPAAR